MRLEDTTRRAIQDATPAIYPGVIRENPEDLMEDWSMGNLQMTWHPWKDFGENIVPFYRA